MLTNSILQFDTKPQFVSNPMSTLFNKTRTIKPANLNGFRVSAKANDASVGVSTVQREKAGSEDYSKEIAQDVRDARKTRDKQWRMALTTLLVQIKSIRAKITKHFMDQPAVAEPMLKILDDVKSLVEIHKVNVGLRKHIPTTDTVMNVANHIQDYKMSERADGIIPVDEVKPKKTTFSPMIDMFTEVANLLYGQRGEHVFLQGNFGPVREETPPIEIQVVEGEVPACIKGMMIRNGPNPQFDPLGMYQWLDGDGMLHATYFQDGKVTYTSRYIQTSRFQQETITGQAEFTKYGDYTGAFGVFSAFTQLLKSVFVLDMSYGHGVANENIAYHGGLLLALEDFDRPYAIKIKEDGDLETLGVYDFKKKLEHNCTPHTKKNPKTGEWFVFGASYTEPYMTYRVVARDGSISDAVPIDVSGPTYMHDFSITKNYVIIMDLPLTFSPEAMLKYNDWIYNFNPLKKARFGIRLRDPKIDAEIQWFEFEEPLFIFHNVNSWESGDKIILYGCRMGAEKPDNGSIPVVKSALLCRALVGENYALEFPELYKFTFDLKTGEATQEKVASNKTDYPKINENYMGRGLSSNFIFDGGTVGHLVPESGTNITFDQSARIPAILKIDLEAKPENQVTRASFGWNIFGSEVTFVPSEDAFDEDDGYLITYVHDEDKKKSYVYVICAKKMTKIAALELPNRVPYGFHSIFIDEEDIKKQRQI